MRRIRTTHAVVVSAAVLILFLAGTATASNMAFKINIPLTGPGTGTSCTSCDTWISLPFDSQFVGQNIRQFCDSNGDGLISTADQIAIVTIQGRQTAPGVFDFSQLDSFISHNCALAFSPNPPYQQTRGVRLRPKTGVSPSIIYVGADRPGTQIQVLNAQARGGSCLGTSCDHWVDMVYHTTARNIRDFCDSDGDGAIGTADQVAIVTVQGRQTGPGVFDFTQVDSFISHNCALVFSPNPPVQVGRAIRLRLKTGSPDILIAPKHF